jgi:hypothetical protein
MSVFLWVYDDGWGGSKAKTLNGDFLTAQTPSCWGHRDSILTASDGYSTSVEASGSLVIGAASSFAKGWHTVTVAMAGASFGVAAAKSLTSLVEYSNSSGKETGSVNLPGVFTSVLASDASHVWALSEGTSGSVSEISASTGALVRIITDKSFNYPDDITSDGTDVWVANEQGGPTVPDQ